MKSISVISTKERVFKKLRDFLEAQRFSNIMFDKEHNIITATKHYFLLFKDYLTFELKEAAPNITVIEISVNKDHPDSQSITKEENISDKIYFML